MAQLTERGLRRSIGVPGLFATAYGNVGSSIYTRWASSRSTRSGSRRWSFMLAGGLTEARTVGLAWMVVGVAATSPSAAAGASTSRASPGSTVARDRRTPSRGSVISVHPEPRD